MDTSFMSPGVFKVFLFALFVSSPFAGFFLSLAAAKTGRSWILAITFFVVGICMYLGCVYLLISYIMAFREHVFSALFLSLAIIVGVSYLSYLRLR